MPSRTTNLNMIKPNGNEPLDVTELNENFQILDDVVPAMGGFSKAGATVKMAFAAGLYHWHLITICTSNTAAMGAWLVYFTTNGAAQIVQLAKGSGITNVTSGEFTLTFTFSSGSAADAIKRVNDISYRGAHYIGYNYD
jgi:hypothetical protein